MDGKDNKVNVSHCGQSRAALELASLTPRKAGGERGKAKMGQSRNGGRGTAVDTTSWTDGAVEKEAACTTNTDSTSWKKVAWALTN